MNLSPLSVFQKHLDDGHLAYQIDESTHKAVFYPRVIAPGTGASLAWKISAGHGTVYAVTVIEPRADPAYNVALIDMDEGFRLMSRVESIPATQVCIGMRVCVRVQPREGDAAAFPVFDPVESKP